MTPQKHNRSVRNTDNARSLPSSTKSSTACPIASGCQLILCDLEGLTYDQAAASPAMDRADATAPAEPRLGYGCGIV